MGKKENQNILWPFWIKNLIPISFLKHWKKTVQICGFIVRIVQWLGPFDWWMEPWSHFTYGQTLKQYNAWTCDLFRLYVSIFYYYRLVLITLSNRSGIRQDWQGVLVTNWPYAKHHLIYSLQFEICKWFYVLFKPIDRIICWLFHLTPKKVGPTFILIIFNNTVLWRNFNNLRFTHKKKPENKF